MLTVEIEHSTDIDVGQDIAVDHQQWIGSDHSCSPDRLRCPRGSVSWKYCNCTPKSEPSLKWSTMLWLR